MSKWGREDVERVTTLLRFLIVVSVVVLLLFGTDDVGHYPAALAILLGLSTVYSVFVLARLRLFLNPAGRWVLTTADAALSLLAVGLTGGARSPALAILLIAVASWAMRFDAVLALLATAITGAILAVVILTVPEPDLADSERLQAAVWWPCYLLFGAVLTAILSRAERIEHTNAVMAGATVAQEREHRQRLESLERQREELLRIITHEFRTPVASLQALTLHLRLDENAATRASSVKALELIRTHADHLVTMVDALREVASSSDPDALDRVQLADAFLPELLEQAVAAAGPGHGRVSIQVDPEVEIVRVDAAKVRRIVTNLVENALRHSDTGDPVEVAARRRSAHIELSVFDRGPGLPAGNGADAFGKFVSLGDRPGTSGLGLWIVDQLSHRLGGHVEPHPRDGAGLEMRVVIPETGGRP